MSAKTSRPLEQRALQVCLLRFVCTHKIQAEEECLSSHILCYECDSRSDPNCADPFVDFSSATSLVGETGGLHQQAAANLSSAVSETPRQATGPQHPSKPDSNSLQESQLPSSNASSKKFPPVATCHGCCVKITSRTPEGVSYVRRTCLTNLQINYFMVGLVCMKESGARGKMCFCETDYCNGSQSTLRLKFNQALGFLLLTSLASGWILA